jgi:hypothetical protein
MRILLTLLLAATLSAARLDSPTGNRTTPPTLASVAPLGVPRGATTSIDITGLNLAGATHIYFDTPGLSGRILRVKELPDLPDVRLGSNGTRSTVDLGPLPPRNQVTVELNVPPDTPIGAVRFRLLTPLGTTPEGRFLIEPYIGESPDMEPNDTPEQAVETFLPAILTGTISKPGDIDLFKIHVDSGDQVVFYNEAMLIGSTLQPDVSILNEDQTVLKEFGAGGGKDAMWFSWRFAKAGTYYIRVADADQSGRPSNFYRILAGNFPLLDHVSPLGLREGSHTAVSLYGWNLDPSKADVSGTPDPGWEDSLALRPKTNAGLAYNEVRLAVGTDPEISSTNTNHSPATAQPVSLPVTINGHIAAPSDGIPVSDYYRFHARAGEKLILEVQARRLGSPLDSYLEVLDAAGKRIERAQARAVLSTTTTLSERDSASPGIRLLSWTGMEPGDYIMIGNEIIRLSVLPKGPDEDTRFEAIDGQRLAYFDTTTEDHSIDKPVYKVLIYPPGKHFTPNGLPLVPLYFQNDDGGPGYSKDSLVHFTAPADGDYLVRIHDVGGLGGEDYTYRLNLRNPRPDFRLSATPANPSVPRGGAVPVTVEARRLDEFNAPIQVRVEGLPKGLHASSGVIRPDQISCTVLLSADPDATLDTAEPLKIVGTAQGHTHWANAADPLTLVSLMPAADVLLAAGTRTLDLTAGGSATFSVHAVRQNGFGGRIPIEVLNLPPGVLIPSVGLNGVLLNENEATRTVTLQALPNAEPGDQLVYIAGRVETRSPLQSVYAASEPILLRIHPSETAARGTPPSR